MVAKNKKKPVQMLERLAEDKDTYVRSWSSREQLFAPVRCLNRVKVPWEHTAPHLSIRKVVSRVCTYGLH